jgi:TonB family protein
VRRFVVRRNVAGTAGTALLAFSAFAAGDGSGDVPPSVATPELAAAVCAKLGDRATPSDRERCAEAYVRRRVAAHIAGRFNLAAALEARQSSSRLKRGQILSARVEIYVDADGRALLTRLVESSGDERYDAALVKCTLAAPYQPATLDDRPAAAWQQLRYTWRKLD